MKYAWPLTEFLKQHEATFGIPAEVSDAHSYAFTEVIKWRHPLGDMYKTDYDGGNVCKIR